MTSLKAIKTTLAALGVKDLSIKFDSEHKIIEARFKLYGDQQQKQISFQEIENVFTDSDSASATGPRSDLTGAGGGPAP